MRGILGLVSNHCSGIGPHLGLRVSREVFLELRQEDQGSSRVATGIWGNILGCKKGVKNSFLVTWGNSGLLSSGYT